MPPKRRRRFQGLYYHSSPPKVLPMNGQIANTNGRRRPDPDDLSVKLSTIRIWMHEKDIGKLTRVLWTGQGNRLRQQASTNPKVKRFLTAVPHVMKSIKDVHQAVIDNSLETLQANLEPPVPPALVTCRDANGLNLIHKAAGLGHATILEYLITTWPDGVHDTDITGKTPLHWAASAKNNMRCYTLLTQAGCDEEAVDYKMKTPSFYRHKPHEIERAFLTYVPEAPRVSPDIATDWEALSDDSGDGKKLDIKIPEMNGFGRHSNAESNENTSEAEMTEAASGQEDEELSKDEDEHENAEPPVENDQDHEEAAKEAADEPEQPHEETEAEKGEEETADTMEDNEDKDNNIDEESQDEKQQTETLNETTANLTKDLEDGEEVESKTEKDPNESNDSNGHIDDNENDKHNSTTDDLKAESEMERIGEVSTDKIEHNTVMPDEKAAEKDHDDISKATEDEERSEREKDENSNETLDNETSKQEIGDKIKDSSDETISESDYHEKSKEGLNDNINGKDNDEESKETLNEVIKTDDEEKTKEKDKPDSEILTGQEMNKTIEENVRDINANEENKDNAEDDFKTLGETLIDIKDEVKDNVKYLANQIKNVFSGNDDGKDEESPNENDDLNTEENKESNDKEIQIPKEDGTLKNGNTSVEDQTKKNNESNDNKQTTNQNDDEKLKKDDLKIVHQTTDNEQNHKENEEKPNGNSLENLQKATESKDMTETANKQESKTNDEEIFEKTIASNENAQEITSTSTDTARTINKNDSNKSTDSDAQPQTQTDTEAPPTIDSANTNSSNENTKPETPPAATQKPSPNETPKKENDKTEEDENNNTNKLMTNEVETTTTTNDRDDLNKPNTAELTTDDQFKELSKSLEKYQKDEETFLENKEKDIGDKLEEMADNFKENVIEMADKVLNVFSTTSSTKDVDEKLHNESDDIVVHTESPQKLISSEKVVKDGESSDESADDDEEPQIEAAKEENSEENEAEANNEEKTDTENQEQTEAEPDTEPEPEIETEPETEPKTNTDAVDSKDSEHNNNETPDNEELAGEGSPTSSLAIEGFVQGDAEDNTVQSQTAAYVHGDEETHIESIIATGDMEQLAQIVLNGDGQKLLNVEATEPEIQAFLKNVPNYMNKIKRVHEAARNGSLLNLQQALDRRKFAIAKDEISPNGATPLHVAVLFGNSDIVRYLSARFPETTTITDNDGRTAMHYAAAINDNGHFYNVLQQLGANPKVVDKMGHTPEDYLGKEELKDTLNYVQLLKRFGAEELEQQLLSDQGQLENQSCQENPIFKTEQGRYLADNLADPLIKALTQVAHKRPNDPLEYLTNYLQSYAATRNTNGRTITQAAIHTGSSHTNSTVLASSKTSTAPVATHTQRQTAGMNGHLNYANADSIEEDSMQQIEEFGDDGNDSDAEISRKLEERDEHGQSMLHFACARSHRKGGLIHLIEEAKSDVTYRDELYRTARDVALQANQLGNAREIDRYIMSLAIVGDIKPFEHFAISGYDHIIDILDDNDTPIIEVLEARGLMELAAYLRTIRPLEELREELHQMIRENNVDRVKEIADGPDGKWLIKAKNYYGRTALHIGILKESIEIVEHFVNRCPESLKIGDNLERTALHYAMGTNIIESVSRILIQNGAKRTHKDLKGRQPSYYFMNKADILRLQEEEDENR